MKEIEDNGEFTHLDYRKAKVVHLVNREQGILFYHRGKSITKEEADAITQKYMDDKKNK